MAKYCSDCGTRLGISNRFVYKGKDYCKQCLPKPESSSDNHTKKGNPMVGAIIFSLICFGIAGIAWIAGDIAFTIIASGAVQKPHYRYLVK